MDIKKIAQVLKSAFKFTTAVTDASGNGIGTRSPSGATIPYRGQANQMLFIGNSIAAQEIPTSSGGGYLQWLSNALLQNINYRLGSRVNVTGILGLSGNRSDQIAAALPALLAANGADYALIEVGQNDVAQYLTAPRNAAQFKASTIQIINLCISYGVTPILLDILGSASVIKTAGMADMWADCNFALKDIARTYPQVILLSYSKVMTDISLSYPANFAAQSDGSFHPNSLGAKNIGDYIYTQLNGVIPNVDLFTSHKYAGSANTMALTGNPLMSGSAAAAGILTGNVPSTGVNVTGNGTGTGVASLVANTNGPTGAQWAQVAYTGPASAVNGTDYVNASTNSVSLATAGLAAGDLLQGFWEFNMTGTPSNFMGAEIFLNYVGATGSVTPPLGPTGTYSRSYGFKQNNSVAPLVSLGANAYGYGVLCTPQMQIPSGTTAIQMFVRAYPVSGSIGATFTVQFGRNRVMKVIS